MSDRLFPLGMVLTVAKVTEGKFFDVRDEVQVSDLRMTCSIEKHLGKGPNTCTASVFNLSEESRALFESKPLQVRIDAGYDGDLGLLFVGDLKFGQSVRSSTGWETKLQLGDGHRAYTHARYARSHPAGTKPGDVVKDIVSTLDLRVPKDAADAVAQFKQFASGASFSGPSHKALTTVLRRSGADWSIQDGSLQILTADGTRGGDVLVIEEGSGMLGSPEFGPPQKQGGKRLLSVKNLLYPALSPGRKVLVRSLQIQGTFKIQRVTHAVDTKGGGYSTIEAVPL